MKRASLGLSVVLVACGGGSSMPADDGGTGDVVVAIDAALEAAPLVEASAIADAGAEAEAEAGDPPEKLTELASNQDMPQDIATDGVAAYWINWGDGTVVSCASGGCNKTPTVLVSGKTYLVAIVTDGKRVYFADEGTPSHSISSCAVAGCNGTPTILANGLNGPYGLTTDGVNVYWTNVSGTVMRTPVTGGALTTMAAASQPTAIATDGANVFWKNTGDGALLELPISAKNATPQTFVSSQSFVLSGAARPRQIATDGANLYWIDDGAGTILSCPKTGCTTPKVLATGQTSARALATDGTAIYWTNASDGTVTSCAVTGCATPTVLAFNQQIPYGIAVDDHAIYWTTSYGSVMRLAK